MSADSSHPGIQYSWWSLQSEVSNCRPSAGFKDARGRAFTDRDPFLRRSHQECNPGRSSWSTINPVFSRYWAPDYPWYNSILQCLENLSVEELDLARALSRSCLPLGIVLLKTQFMIFTDQILEGILLSSKLHACKWWSFSLDTNMNCPLLDSTFSNIRHLTKWVNLRNLCFLEFQSRPLSFFLYQWWVVCGTPDLIIAILAVGFVFHKSQHPKVKQRTQ